MDTVPEFAARLGVDAGGWLVEQEKLRPMQHAGGEREALLPAARELSDEFAGILAKLHPFDDVAHRRARVRHLVDAGNEFEVLGDGEVLVVAEALRHVADLPPDRRSVGGAVFAG